MADRRYTLIKLFIEWKGKKYMPSKMHPAIRWSESNPFLDSQESVSWRIVDSNLKVDTVKSSTSHGSESVTNIARKESELASEMPASDGIPFISGLKRKRVYIVPTNKKQSIKKIKFCHNVATTSESAPVQLDIPLGTQWQNNSCAYDAIITILFNMWSDPNPATTSLEDTQCVMFDALIKSFHTHESRHRDVES